jgi:hypothetical protein
MWEKKNTGNHRRSLRNSYYVLLVHGNGYFFFALSISRESVHVICHVITSQSNNSFVYQVTTTTTQQFRRKESWRTSLRLQLAALET